MDSKIPSHLKRYIRKAREGKKEKKITQKQKQVNKQSQIVIVNQEPSKRKSQPRRRKISSNDEYPNIAYIPTSIPNMSVAMNQPQIMSQPIPQSISQFESVPIYRNPFREAAVRNQFNQPPQFASNQVEQNLPFVSPSPPPPLEPEIVLEPNNIDFLSRPLNPEPISSASPVFQGFTENQAVNQLNEQIRLEKNAYSDFGGDDAQDEDLQRRLRLAKQLNMGDFYANERNRFSLFPPPMSPDSPDTQIGMGRGGGGGEGPDRIRKRGRPSRELPQEELQSISDYAEIRYGVSPNKRTEEQNKIFKEGQKLFISRSRTHPEVIELKDSVKVRVLKERENKKKK
jgi:hypothetical protein